VIAHVDREAEDDPRRVCGVSAGEPGPEELAVVLDELVNATIQAERQKSAPRSTTGTTEQRSRG